MKPRSALTLLIAVPHCWFTFILWMKTLKSFSCVMFSSYESHFLFLCPTFLFSKCNSLDFCLLYVSWPKFLGIETFQIMSYITCVPAHFSFMLEFSFFFLVKLLISIYFALLLYLTHICNFITLQWFLWFPQLKFS